MNTKLGGLKTKELTRSTLIVFSTELEAKATIDCLGAKGRGHLRWFPGGAVMICGMGSINAAARILEVGHCFDQIWNIGIAGALKPLQGIHPVGRIEKLKSLPATTSAHSHQFFDKLHPAQHIGEGLTLVTSDFPIFDETLKSTLSHDLVDMEGWGIAYAASLLHKPLKMWKMPSDSAGENDQHALHANLQACAFTIADFVEKQIHA